MKKNEDELSEIKSESESSEEDDDDDDFFFGDGDKAANLVAQKGGVDERNPLDDSEDDSEKDIADVNVEIGKHTNVKA